MAGKCTTAVPAFLTLVALNNRGYNVEPCQMDETRMILPDDETPKVRILRESEPIPAVDPEDLRQSWKVRTSPEAKRIFLAVSRRQGMIIMLAGINHGQLLAPWKHGEELDDAVFRIAATFPLRELPNRMYTIPGDEAFGFDPNAFLRQLVEETGVSHTWEPIQTKMPEGSCTVLFHRVEVRREAPKEVPSERLFVDEPEARRQAREVLWDAWDKYHHLKPMGAEWHDRMVAGRFADFVIDNIDLAQQLVSFFSSPAKVWIPLPS